MLTRETEIVLGGQLTTVAQALDVRHYQDPDDIEINEQKQWISRADLAALQLANARLPLLDETVRQIANDLTAPTVASFQFPEIVEETQRHKLTITFADNIAINPAQINTANISVVKLNGMSMPDGATVVNVVQASTAALVAGPSITAEYLISPASGTWTASDDGQYRVQIALGAIEDTSGNQIMMQDVGDFSVQIGEVTAMIFGSDEMVFGSDAMVYGS